MTESPSHFGYFDIAQYRFWIADCGLSEKNFERNRFIGLFSRVSIQNLKHVVSEVEPSSNPKSFNHPLSARASTFSGTAEA